MDHDDDPITHFFPDEDDVDLYAVLSLTSDASEQDIKSAYRRLALKYHPDKHATSSESAKHDASIKFQQVGFAYTVLSDKKRRQRYDNTGKTDESLELAAGEDGWEAYFEQLFDRVTRGKLDEMKMAYQGSHEEIQDLKTAYAETNGLIGEIMNHIPHSTNDDEQRFVDIISELISSGELPDLPGWRASIRDDKSKFARKKASEKEAKEAEQAAKELGVWDEFYGSGKTGARKGNGKGAKPAPAAEDDEDHSALQALILKKRKNMDDFFDGLAAKYAEPEPKSKSKKRTKDDDEDTGPTKKKKARKGVPSPPEIDEAEFQKLQSQLFSEGKAKGRKAK